MALNRKKMMPLLAAAISEICHALILSSFQREAEAMPILGNFSLFSDCWYIVIDATRNLSDALSVDTTDFVLLV